MLNVEELFSLYSELAIALAGFSGVTSAFAGRERKFRPTERTRLYGVLLNSSSVLAGCLAFYSGSANGLVALDALRVAGSVSFVFSLPIVLVAIPNGWRHHSDPDSTTEVWVLAAVSVLGLTTLTLYAASVVLRAGPGLVTIGFSIQLLFGLWMFIRLLMRPN